MAARATRRGVFREGATDAFIELDGARRRIQGKIDLLVEHRFPVSGAMVRVAG
jgi:hypothetical protein